MIYSFTLDENDYLTHQLFVSSVSKNVISKRRRSWAVTTATFLILAWLFNSYDNEFLRNYFLLLSVICAIFYPQYSKWRYKKHYKKHGSANLAKSFGQIVFVEFLDQYILTKDSYNSESKISLSQIEYINELPEHILLRLKGGQSLILPTLKIEHPNELRTEVIGLAQKVGLDLTDNSSWEWK